MPELLENPVGRLLERLQTDTPRWIVGLAGMPGAGKSTLAAQIVQEVNARTQPNTLIALGMDGFHLTKAQLRQMPDAEEAFARRGATWTFDVAAFADRLQRLRHAAGRESVEWPDFQHDVGDPVEAAFSVPPDVRLILVEGLYLLHDADGWDAVRDSFDERWYLDTPIDAAMQRLVRRHQTAWNWTQEMAERRVASNDRLNAELVLQSCAAADLRVEA